MNVYKVTCNGAEFKGTAKSLNDAAVRFCAKFTAYQPILIYVNEYKTFAQFKISDKVIEVQAMIMDF
jgi:hypothetical protein